MATPSVVQKISLTKETSDFSNCNCVRRNVTSQFRSSCQINSCRFSWCNVCQHQMHSEYSENSEEQNFPYSIEEPNDASLETMGSSFNFGLEFQSLSPLGSSHSNSVEEDKINSDFNFAADKIYSKTSRSCSKNWLSTCSNDIQGRYLKEVEVLRGRLIELRENLPLCRGTTSLNNSMKAETKKQGKLSLSLSSTHSKVSKKMKDYQRSQTPDGKRLRVREDISRYGSNLVAALKRPRDGSPSQNQYNEQSNVEERKPLSKEMNSSLLLESEEEDGDGLTDETSEIEWLEEELDDGDDFNTEDMARSIHHSLKMTSVSPPYVNENFLQEISLEDTNATRLQRESEDVHPSLRPSLFSNVAPYIKFSSHETKAEKDFPPAIQKILKWRLTNITPIVVRKTVSNSGYKLIRKSPDWCGTWGKHMKSVSFRTLKENQKLNHFPGTFQIGRKDRLWKNLCRLMTKYGKKEFGFIPRTYILPQDSKHLRSVWEKNGGQAKWIIKPPASARGTGIKVVNRWTQIPKKAPLIVQKYISNPYLINGSKFDLRLYVLVTSFNPLRIYLYDNGLVRFASVKYSDDMNSLSDRYMHLTNYSINKLSSQYTQNEDAEACQGHKWTIKTLWTYLEGKVNIKALWENLSGLVIKTMIGGESSISQLSWTNLPSRYCSYELFGVDVLLDENLKPWLLEVNISPSLHSSSPLDLAVKGPMVKDIMNIAGYQIPKRLSAIQEKELLENLGVSGSILCHDPRMYAMGLSDAEKKKQSHFSEMEDREMYLEAILEDLTPDDVRHLIQYEDELTQLGSFGKIFPTTTTHQYQRFFESCKYYNMLFDAWEMKYHRIRIEGIKLLETFCQNKVHLDVSEIDKSSSQVYVSDSGCCIESFGTDRISMRAKCYSTNSIDDGTTHLNKMIICNMES